MRIEVRDTLECSEEHSVEIHWHLAESCAARVSGHAMEIDCATLRMRIKCPAELNAPEVVVGRDDPPLGWISRRLDEKEPSPVIVCQGRVAGDTGLLTVIRITIGAT